MDARIQKLLELTLKGEMYCYPQKTDYDPADENLSEHHRQSKRICEFLLNQKPMLTPYSAMTGFFRFDNSVVGTAFNRTGHVHTQAFMAKYYCVPQENLSTMEWQHATPDYRRVLSVGIKGIIAVIDEALGIHKDEDKREFLLALRRIAEGMVAWAHKCSAAAKTLAETVEEPEYKANLERLSETLRRIPEEAPQTLYEAVLCVYICYGATMDSPGTLDLYFREFYDRDLREGKITREEAKTYFQELYLMLQAIKRPDYAPEMFTVGSESHFSVGGYLPDGSDGFGECSKAMIESLMELPIYNPQVTFRWTKKTPREVLRFMLDCERKDPNTRLAFINEDKQAKSCMELLGVPYDRAIEYLTVGCNEPAFLGSITGGTSAINSLRCVETLFHSKGEEIAKAKDFEEFYDLFEQELFSDLGKAFAYDDWYNLQRAKDVNYISNLFFQDCIEKATSLTQGGCEYVVASPWLMGIGNVIDCLSVVKQFVFDEKLLTMEELCKALQSNWQGYEDLQTVILRKGDFFGNDTERSNQLAQRFYDSLFRYYSGKKNVFGYPWLVGDLTGQNNHAEKFGRLTKATPDGRKEGDLMKFGLGQNEGRDRTGLTALLNSIAGVDPNGIGCGATVTNLTLDKQLVKDDANFEKTVDLLETYFKNGGVHFQLTYVSREDMLKAKETPEDYKHLRVRVSGFSDYFVKLKAPLQDDVIARTMHS